MASLKKSTLDNLRMLIKNMKREENTKLFPRSRRDTGTTKISSYLIIYIFQTSACEYSSRISFFYKVLSVVDYTTTIDEEMACSTLTTIQIQLNLYGYSIFMILRIINGNIFIVILFNRHRQNACSIYLLSSVEII